MYYKIKNEGSLEEVASKLDVPSQLLSAFNPEIVSRFVTTDELLYVPNVLENPEQNYSFSRITSVGIIEKARSAIGNGIRYE